MSKPSYVYVIYVSTTPEKLWKALVDGEMTKKYWNHENASDWKAGSRWEHRRVDGSGKVDVCGKILESTPPRRLVLSFAYPAEIENPARVSRVTFDIEPGSKGPVRLTVRHEDLEPDVLDKISKGWPLVLSGLKSLLETGEALDVWG
jgi:uncharacterized protein YndB with AHSA1/START domain